MNVSFAVLAWVAMLLFCIPYVMRKRHPQTRPFAAYLLFASILSFAAAGLYFAIGYGAVAVGLGDALSHPVGITVYLALVLLPAFLIARWQLKKPPREIYPP